MRREIDEVTRRVKGEEDLRSGRVTCCPCDEVRSHDNGLLGLARDVARDEGHGEGLGRPEGEDEVVGHEEASAGGVVCVDYGHEDDGSDERTV